MRKLRFSEVRSAVHGHVAETRWSQCSVLLFFFEQFHAFNEAVQELFLLGVAEHIIQFIKAEEKGIIIRKTAVRYTRGRAKTFVR